MKEIITGCFCLFSMLFGLCISAEDVVEQLTYRNEYIWFPRLRDKLYEAYNEYYKEDEGIYRPAFLQDEVRDLFLEYFQTEESLLFDPEQFYTGSLNERTDYIASDDNAIRVFSWDTITWSDSSRSDSIIQYRGSDGKLRTVSLSQIIQNDFNYSYRDVTQHGVYRIVTIKEGVYLIYTLNGLDYNMVHDFITVALQQDKVVPYHAFNNKMQLRLSLSYLPLCSPAIISIQALLEEEPFSIEITQLWIKHPEQFKYFDWELIKKKAFEHKESLVFNGFEFAGNYSLLIEPIWEGPVNITQYFPEIESWESVIQKGHKNAEPSAEVEILFDASNTSNGEGSEEQQEFNVGNL